MYIYIYIYVHTLYVYINIYIYIYIYIYICRDRERERERFTYIYIYIHICAPSVAIRDVAFAANRERAANMHLNRRENSGIPNQCLKVCVWNSESTSRAAEL